MDQNHDKYGGTGLGLAICRRLVNLLNGQIEVSSEVGKGSVFSVRIDSVRFSQEFQGVVEKTGAGGQRPLFQGSLAVVAEDNVFSRCLLTEMLKLFGVKSLEAENGLDAIRQVCENSPDIVFMDIDMPVLDGVEAARGIRRELASAPPIVAVTVEDKEGEVKALAEIFEGVLTKPVSLARLTSELERLLVGRKGSALPVAGSGELKESPPVALPESTLLQLPEILKVLASEVELCARLKVQLHFGKMRELAGRVKVLADAHDLSRLSKWADELLSAAANFDPGAAEVLSRFPNIVEELSSHQHRGKY